MFPLIFLIRPQPKPQRVDKIHRMENKIQKTSTRRINQTIRMDK